MDEATSALDAETESEISNSIANLKGEITLIVISHRFSTISHADRIIYLEDGGIKAEGNFDSLMKNNVSFRKQANLMGFEMGSH
jgi:ABC-type multidrug transport system fused ATPase/permease subunit